MVHEQLTFSFVLFFSSIYLCIISDFCVRVNYFNCLAELTFFYDDIIYLLQKNQEMLLVYITRGGMVKLQGA